MKLVQKHSPRQRVVIGSPIQEKPNILVEYLKSLEELYHEGVEVSYYFVDNNKSRASSDLLLHFQKSHPNVTIASSQDVEMSIYFKDEYTHLWDEKLIWKVAQLKDQIIQYAREHCFDYLFILDSDLVLHPQTLEQLIRSNKDIISNIFWTQWYPGEIELPQVWLQDEYTFYRKDRQEMLDRDEEWRRSDQFLQLLRQPGIYEVGGLGACTLISRKALEAGMRFAEIPNLSFRGEDRHFCVRAQALGFSLFVETQYPALHLYREADLSKVEAYKAKAISEIAHR